MPIEGNLDYALTRVYARHGRRLDEADWRRLEASRDLGHYTAAVRSTALAGWVGSLDAERDCHGIERALRSQWRHYVDSVASWHPCEWQAWLKWLAYLPSVSLLSQLVRNESVPAWMLADPELGPLAPGTSADRAAALSHTALAPLAPAITGRTLAGAAWRSHWKALQPQGDADTRRYLDMLRRAIEQHDRGLLHATDTAAPQRQQLAGRLQGLIRNAAGTVIVTVCHLGLLALDLERLRGGLARRCVFGANQAAHA